MAIHFSADAVPTGSLRTPRPSRDSAPARPGAVLQQVLGFLAVGVVCTVASVAIYTLLRPVTGVQPANSISLILTSVLNTELNRRHSFGIRERRNWVRDHRRGLWVMLLALGLTSGSLWLLHAIAPEPSVAQELVTITVANVLAALTRFLLLRYWIFRRVHTAASAEAA
jgi:putative flippase GtrA